MLASEVIYNIVNLKAGGKSTDDRDMSDMNWLYIVDYYRAQLLRQQNTANQSISPFSEQEIQMRVTLCEWDDNLHEGTLSIPKPIEGHKRDLITHVGGDDEQSYQRQTFNTYLWKQYSKYTKRLPFYFMKESRVYIGNLAGNRHIVVRGVFERPIEVARMQEDYNPMRPLDFQYPMSNSMMDSVVKMIADAEMKVLHMIPKDNVNDSTDNP